MADKKISDVAGTNALVGAAAGDEILPYEKGGVAGTMTAQQIADLTPTGSGSAAPAFINYISGRYYPCLPFRPDGPGPATIGAFRTYYIPFIPHHNVTISDLWVEVWGALSATAGALAIYASQISGGKAWPTGNPLAHGVSNFAPVNNTVFDKALNTNVSLTAGTLYFIALQVDNTATFNVASTGLTLMFMGSAAAGTDTTAYGGYVGDVGGTVGTWIDKTNSPTDSSISEARPYFMPGFKVA